MNWSAKLFLSVACCFGTLTMFTWMIASAPHGMMWKAVATAALPLAGFILALLALRYDEKDKWLSKAMAMINGMFMLAIAWLYYDFAMTFHF